MTQGPYSGGSGKGDVAQQSTELYLDGDTATPDRLVFATPPQSEVLPGTTFSINLQQQDGYGNIFAQPVSSVAISIITNPSGGTLSGTTSVNTLNGTANFTSLTINIPGVGYVLQASATGLTPVDFTINVTPGPYGGGSGKGDAGSTVFCYSNLGAGAASSTPTLCVNTLLTPITHATFGGVAGIGTATGLPSGVTVNWASDVITISGTPTQSGTFNYTIPLTGGCGNESATGTITVTSSNTISLTSANGTNAQVLCPNASLTSITYATIGATGATVSGLPAGVNGSWTSNVFTISGTPSEAGIFNYTINLTGGCGNINATGTITVYSGLTAILSGSQTICPGNSSVIYVTVTGGTPPYHLIYSDGTNNYTVTNYTSGSDIIVAPFSSTTYSITSVTDANNCPGNTYTGNAILSVDSTSTTDGGITWSNGTPTAQKSVLFDGGTAVINSNFSACTLELKNNAVVTVNSGFDVVLNGRLIVESGSVFTLSNNANLLQNNTLTNSGNIIVKRNSSSLKRLDYTLWSSPVSGQGLYAFSKTTLPNRFYIYNTNANIYSNSLGFNLIGLQYPPPLVAPNGINGTDTNNTLFALGKGYLIRVPWDHPTVPTIWTGEFKGVPNNGDIIFSMVNGGEGQRYNLIGNPYPSPISMSQFVENNSANITGALYFWRETNNNTYNNAYCSWAGGTFVSNGEAQVFDPNGVIRTGQGFFVEALGNATSVYFNNSQRLSNHANQFFKTNNTTSDDIETNRYWLNLTNSLGVFSQMAVGYISNATNGVDVYDGRNINTGDYLLNSILDNTDYTIQGKALPFDINDVIPLSYKVSTAGTYNISIDHTDGVFSNGQLIYLKDNTTATIHNLSNGNYSFTSNPGSFTDRFEIVYQTQQLNADLFTANSVGVINQDDKFIINSKNILMKSVKIFDIGGRLLQEHTTKGSDQILINKGFINQVLLFKITLENGLVVTKKVLSY
ncbi:hypothetical protein [Flavobacterium macrobrachii]|nr:hypothetical protein [Flavobacterium macrobrachii]